ncbi:MAG: DUF4837 family protein [Bacteroidaceae bacterium]|nr:DUF4837 family protein [Bacteroidaceae bacterium]
MPRLKRTYFPLLLFLVFSLTSCKDGKMIAPQASGRPYEVMVIMDSKLWEAPTGRALFNVLDTDVPGLPQPERSFRISQADPKDYNRTLRLFRNLIEVNIDPTQFTRVRMKFQRNVYADNQIILTINAPSNEEFAKYVSEHTQDIIDFFHKTEINRLCLILKDEYSRVGYDLAKEIFDCDLHAPKELQHYKKGKDFLWLSNDAPSGMVCMVVYSYPYEGPNIFNKKYILHKRDSVMQRNIPGSEPDMYVQTDTLYTSVKPIMVHGKYAFESRGLWFMRNDGMGGPFVSHSRVDEKNNRVVTVEGFVFAPEKMKRGLMRRMEGALYTLLLPHEQEEEAETAIEEDNKTAKQ